jgi:predicted enzyme related to lactoylglutathione lyase
MIRSRHAPIVLIGAALLAAACTRTAPLPAISADPIPEHIPGKLVWRALLTDDPLAARTFYGALFGWTFESTAIDEYTLIRAGGRPVGAVLEVEPSNDTERVTQWLSFLSVRDVDALIPEFELAGTIHRKPLDVPGFGRVAVVADPQQAPLALFRSATGDPPDGVEPAIGEFLWTDYVAAEPLAAADFYRRIAGWDVRRHDSPSGNEYWVFWQADQGRAGMFENPWPEVNANWLPYVRVADTAASVARVTQLGGTIVLAPSPEIRNGTTAIVLDPQGAALVLQSYPF